MNSTIYWTSLCGNEKEKDAFWSSSISWNTSSPDLTECFQQTVLAWAPCLYLWVTSAFYIPILCVKYPTIHRNIRKYSRFNLLKTVICAVLVLLNITDLVAIIYYNGELKNAVLANYLQPSILAATYMFACFLTLYEFYKGIHTSAVFIIFWGILLIIKIVPFRSKLYQGILPPNIHITSKDLILLVTFYSSYTLVFIQFICHLFTDYAALNHGVSNREIKNRGKDEETKHTRKPCPQTFRPWWQGITFLWVTGLIVQGYRKPLKEHQLWQLTPNNKSENIIRSAFKLWDNSNKDQQKQKRGFGTKSRRIYNLNNVQHKENNRKSLWVVILKGFVPYFVMGGLFLIGYAIIIFTSALILSVLITFISQKNVDGWKGYFYVTAIFVLLSLKSIFFQWNLHFCKLAGMRMRTALIGIIYRKALQLNNKARSNYTIGTIVNLVSIDTQQIQLGSIYLNFAWFSILSTIVGMYLLWLQLGVSIFAGVGVLIVVALFEFVIVRETKKYQEKQMAFKDQRLQLITEILTGIKVFKLYAWETSLRDHILAIRKDELNLLWKAGLYNMVLCKVLTRSTQNFVALACFAAFTLISDENILDANTAFVSIFLLSTIQNTIVFIPDAYSFSAQMYVAIERMNKFIHEEEIHENNTSRIETSNECSVSITNGTFSWAADLPPILRSIDLLIPENKLVAVVGHVGSGKSSLLSAILGELEVFRGHCAIKGSLAYVPQQAWILNTSLRENVLFTKDFDIQNYQEVIDACALNPDISILPVGDLTEIGEKGINLSGGQKQRVSLARAVYQNSDIYLLDDPLSAVDAHVGKHIFDKVIGPNGNLKNKTRILVTNALTFLPQTDQIICLTDGKISETGSYNELVATKGAFSEFVEIYKTNAEQEEDIPVLPFNTNEDKTVIDYANLMRNNPIKRYNKSENEVADKELPACKIDDKNLTGEESVIGGKIKLAVYLAWLKSYGRIPLISLIIWLVFVIMSLVGPNIWLSEWTNDPPTINGTQDRQQNNFRLQYFGILILVSVFCQCGLTFSMAFGFINSSKILHESLLSNVLRAPMSFYDTTPLGRIINRLSSDVEILDVVIPMTLRNYIGAIQILAITIILISYSAPILLAVFVPLCIFYLVIQISYVTTSRQIRRIEFINRSPINNHFNESITGAVSLRAYGQIEQFIAKSDRLVDENHKAYFAYLVAERWMSIILENIANIIILSVGIFTVYTRDTISPGAAGLSLSFALQVTHGLQYVTLMSSELDNYIVSIERMVEYINCPQEAPNIVEDKTPESKWPSKGSVEFKDYATRYRQELDLVLHNVSFKIRPQEKVGIVGRTGAGKSSITLALFRIIESTAGKILVDGINIATIGLHDVRSKLTIIPQDPVLFSGTMKLNIDPFDLHSDEEIWKALELAHLKPYILSLPSGLQYQCGEGGVNLSHGQRQLVCLARAVLRKTKILVLDEATAAVDLETDDLIQKTIRSEFKGCTIITIAHRLNTIMDYDRILVLDKGCVVEYDSPMNLLAEKTSVFYNLAKNEGLIV